MVKLTKTEKLVTALKTGKPFTAKQIARRFGLKSPTSAIRHIREDGFRVVTEPVVTTGGDRYFEYRMSKYPQGQYAR